MDTVFVAMWFWNNKRELAVLDWALDHYENNKTKILITRPYEIDAQSKAILENRAQSDYFPKCRAKKFQAEVLIHQGKEIDNICFELVTKHGMQKLVCDDAWKSEVIGAFDKNPNICCKIWFVDWNGKLTLEREFPVALENAHMENEKLKNVIDEKLQQMIEQAHTYEQRIDQLKESWALNTSFNFQELKQAAQNFSDSLKIGGGRFGSVYKGTFRGTTVAIKKFESQDMQELSMFRQEIVILTTVRHPNLINLIGACSEPPILVYEFLSKGSLRNCLTNTSNTTPLPWQVRTRIIGQICLALIFLHSNKPTQIVHGNLKPNNIFLDTNYTVKLSDFGLITDTDTDINASLAYIEPEYLHSGEMTPKSDVYSFGVIILQLLTGKSHLRVRKTIEESMRTGTLHTMIDVSAGSWPLDQAEEMAKIGIRCADVSRSNRPDLANDVWPTIECLMKFPDEIIHDNPPLLGTSHRDN